MIWILNGLEARLTPFLLRMEGPTDRASGHTLVPANMRHLIAIASWKGVTKTVASMRCAIHMVPCIQHTRKYMRIQPKARVTYSISYSLARV